MKKGTLFLTLCSLFFAPVLFAFPSSLYWTVCTTEVIDTGILDFQLSDYFSILNRRGRGSRFPTDIGLTLGIFTLGKVKVEAGFDYFGGFDFPWFFNAKAGIEEGALFKNSPSFSLGIFDIGLRDRETDYNVIDFVVGKELGCLGTVYVGGYWGSPTLREDQHGYMVGYIKSFCKAKDCFGVDYYKWAFLADYASGRNFVGGGGFGVAYNVSSKINILTGPTWFNDVGLLGRWKWTVQFNFLFRVFDPCKKKVGQSNATSESAT